MLDRRLWAAALALSLALVWTASASAQTIPTTVGEARTTADPQVPLDELELLVLPLDRVELEVEAAAWVALVKRKVHALADAEIAAKYKRLEIARAEEAAAAARAASGAMEEALDAVASGEEAGEALEAAEEATAEAQAALSAAAEVEQRVDEDQGVEEVAEAAAVVAGVEESTMGEVAGLDPAAIGSEQEVAVEELEEAAVAADEAAQAKTEVREAIFERVAELRNERTDLLQRAHLVLDELEEKGGVVEEPRRYLDAVAGIQIDVTDTSATWATAVGWLKAPQGGLRLLENMARFLMVLFVAWILSLLVSKIAERAMRHSRGVSELTRVFVAKSARRIILAVGFVVGLSTLEIDVGPMLAIVGGATFVLAFALQDSLGNLASGFMIMMFRPFDIGHVVSVAGARGRVHSMNLVSTTIKTADNQTIVVPNRKIWGDVITNVTGSARRRVDMEFHVGLEADLDQALAVLEGVVRASPLVLEEPAPVIRVAEIEEHSISIACRPWAKTEDRNRLRSELTRAALEAFRGAGIPIPV